MWLDFCFWQDEGKVPYLYVELDFKEVQVWHNHYYPMGFVSNVLAYFCGLVFKNAYYVEETYVNLSNLAIPAR